MKAFELSVLKAQAYVTNGDLTLPKTYLYKDGIGHRLEHLDTDPDVFESDMLFIKAFCSVLRPDLVFTTMLLRMTVAESVDEADLSQMGEGLLVVFHSREGDAQVYLGRVVRDRMGFVEEFIEETVHAEAITHKIGNPFAVPDEGIPGFLMDRVSQILDLDMTEALPEEPAPRHHQWSEGADQSVMH